MRVTTFGLLVLALGLGTAALLAGPGAGASKEGSLSASVGPGYTIGMSASTVTEGAYSITVSDQSAIHDFHLSGPGVDEATSISGTGTTQWSVTLRPGIYHFQCDAHASTMNGDLTVTSATTTQATTTAASATAATTTTETATTAEAATTTTTPAPTGTSPAPLAVHVSRARATRTAVTVSVSSNRHGHAVVQLLRGRARVAQGSGPAPGRITVRVRHPLTPGRYALKVTVSAGGATATASKTIPVR